MKKTLLLSLTAIAALTISASASPVSFSGNVSTFAQTTEITGEDLFTAESTALTTVGQLRAGQAFDNGIFVGGELTGTISPDAEDAGMRATMATGRVDTKSGAAITQGFVGYKNELGSIKVGRQNLSKTVSPFAFSETWSIATNGFDAVVASTDVVADTTITAAYIKNASGLANLSEYSDVNGDNGVYALTATNKTIPNFTATGSYLFAQDANDAGSLNGLIVDTEYDAGTVVGSIQAATIFGDATNENETYAVGVKAVAPVDADITVNAAYTFVSEGDVALTNLGGAGTKTVLYTQMIANDNYIALDNQTLVLGGSWNTPLGSVVSANYGYTIDGSLAENDSQELDLVCSKNITKDISVMGAYVYTTDEASDKGANTIRFIADYRF